MIQDWLWPNFSLAEPECTQGSRLLFLLPHLPYSPEPQAGFGESQEQKIITKERKQSCCPRTVHLVLMAGKIRTSLLTIKDLRFHSIGHLLSCTRDLWGWLLPQPVHAQSFVWVLLLFVIFIKGSGLGKTHSRFSGKRRKHGEWNKPL